MRPCIRRHITKVALAICALLSLGQSDAAVLRSGDSLTTGQRLYSDDGRYFGTLQPDGNFVVYRNDGHVIWATYTHGRGAVRATMQMDGNFVLYDGANRRVWATNTRGPWHMFGITEHGQAMILTPKDWWQTKTGNANFAVGNPLIFPYGFTFQAGTVHRTSGPHSLTFQHDGNMVVYRNGQPIWISGTAGATSAGISHGIRITDTAGAIRFQPPARYPSPTAPGTALFTTLGYVALFPNGNLVAYRAVPVWQSPNFDWVRGIHGDGPRCVGNPHTCPKQLLGILP